MFTRIFGLVLGMGFVAPAIAEEVKPLNCTEVFNLERSERVATPVVMNVIDGAARPPVVSVTGLPEGDLRMTYNDIFELGNEPGGVFIFAVDGSEEIRDICGGDSSALIWAKPTDAVYCGKCSQE